MKRPTQKECIFWQLFKNKRQKNEYIPVHGFMGEVYIDPLDQWGFVSYEVSARLSEMNKDNPRLLEWVIIQGRASYIQYRGYRIRDNATPDDIDDPKLKAMYKKISIV